MPQCAEVNCNSLEEVCFPRGTQWDAPINILLYEMYANYHKDNMNQNTYHI